MGASGDAGATAVPCFARDRLLEREQDLSGVCGSDENVVRAGLEDAPARSRSASRDDSTTTGRSGSA